MRVRILPYKRGSKSARALADALGVKRLRLQGSRFTARPGDVVINWGNTQGADPERIAAATVLNSPQAIANAQDKLRFFDLVTYAYPTIIPKYWKSREDIPNDAFPIVCRTVLGGHSGQGIVIANSREELVPAPLYVKYERKQQEYRVHVAGGEVIAVQRKARRRDVPDDQVNWQVRNHANGFVFARQNVVAPEQVTDAAKSAVAVTGLDFGAADVIWNDSKERAYVLEVNTAPGLEGSTVQDYAEYFRTKVGITNRGEVG